MLSAGLALRQGDEDGIKALLTGGGRVLARAVDEKGRRCAARACPFCPCCGACRPQLGGVLLQAQRRETNISIAQLPCILALTLRAAVLAATRRKRKRRGKPMYHCPTALHLLPALHAAVLAASRRSLQRGANKMPAFCCGARMH